MPLGSATADAEVRIRFGAGECRGRSRPTAGHLVDGQFVGGVVRADHGPGRVELEQDTTLACRGSTTLRIGPSVLPADDSPRPPARHRVPRGPDARPQRTPGPTDGAVTPAPARPRIRLPRAAGATSIRAESGAAVTHRRGPDGAWRPGSGAGWRSARARSTRRGSRGRRQASNRPVLPRRRTGSIWTSREASARSGWSGSPDDSARGACAGSSGRGGRCTVPE